MKICEVRDQNPHRHGLGCKTSSTSLAGPLQGPSLNTWRGFACLFSVLLFLKLCVCTPGCVCVCGREGHTRHGTYLEVRGQLYGVTFFPPPLPELWVQGIQLQSPGFRGKHFQPLSIPAAPGTAHAYKRHTSKLLYYSPSFGTYHRGYNTISHLEENPVMSDFALRCLDCKK